MRPTTNFMVCTERLKHKLQYNDYMSWLLLIIICLLSYIAYKLYELNRSRKQELTAQLVQQEDDLIRELMPHLYKIKSKETINTFLSEYPNHLEKFHEMQGLEEEKDIVKKVKMKEVLDDIRESTQLLYKRKGNATDYEIQFVLWSYLNDAYKSFPNANSTLDAYMGISNYEEILALSHE